MMLHWKGKKVVYYSYTPDYINQIINNYKSSMGDVLGQPLYREIFSEVSEQEIVVAVPDIVERVFSNGVPDYSGN